MIGVSCTNSAEVVDFLFAVRYIYLAFCDHFMWDILGHAKDFDQLLECCQ